ncbi:MAG: methyltransferase [Bacteroidetes bacterium]|nr:MAG: methyltransferase [Bacteroidota bacterium]RLD47632.1 MAG: methyltransferase [Bacteroidota bacterium]RLD71614.1 MAG: methyltransferase [Bacteroidota bacterium]RLD89542.1 MAG: methyltransferase [Bacteroidota bacterium]
MPDNMISTKLEKYIEEFTTVENEVLRELNRQTHLRTFYPRMLSGSVQGKFLEMICRMLQPKNVLEIGTFTGYSAIAMAMGMPENGLVYTIEVNEEMEPFIREYIAKAGMEHKIKLLMGDALQIVPAMEETFDLVFIDADKEQYVTYYDLAMEKLKPGGFILADNVLWSGKVLEDDTRSDKETKGIKVFNQHVKNDDRAEQVMLSIRDGLLLVRKL